MVSAFYKRRMDVIIKREGNRARERERERERERQTERGGGGEIGDK